PGPACGAPPASRSRSYRNWPRPPSRAPCRTGAPLGVPDGLVGEEGEAVTDGLGGHQAHRLLVASRAEESLTGPEHDREDDKAQLVDQIVLDQSALELVAGVDENLPGYLLLQLRDLVHHVALQDGRVAPPGLLQGGGHDVLGHVVQPVRPLARPGGPPRGEPLLAAPAQQQGLGAQRLVGLDLGPLFEVLAPELAEPAAELEALLAVRVLDDSVERGVRSDHDLSHAGSPSGWSRPGPASRRNSRWGR